MLNEEQVTHALTAIDVFGTYMEEVRAAEAGLIPSDVDTRRRRPLGTTHTCEQSDTWYVRNGTNSTSSSGMVFQGGLEWPIGVVADRDAVELPHVA